MDESGLGVFESVSLDNAAADAGTRVTVDATFPLCIQILHKERLNVMSNTCRIYKQAQMVKNLSQKASYKIHKVPFKSATHKIEQFCNGVW